MHFLALSLRHAWRVTRFALVGAKPSQVDQVPLGRSPLFLLAVLSCAPSRPGNQHTRNGVDAGQSSDANSQSPPGPKLPRAIAADTLPVSGDLPVFYVAPEPGARQRMVFFHGACTHGLGYIQAFQFAASRVGPLLALQGEHRCGTGIFRSYSFDMEKTDARVDAGFEAAAPLEASASVTAIGYSQGAIVAELLAAAFPAKYRQLILIGAPRMLNAQSLKHLSAAVLMAGTYDNRDVMRQDVAALARVGVPATFIEIPKARHGQLLDGERVMGEAMQWLREHAKAD